MAGGWAMVPILICSAIALAIVLERCWTLRRKSVLPPGLGDEVRQWARSGQLDSGHIETLSNGSPLGELLAAALAVRRQPRELIKERINVCAGQKTEWEGALKMPYGSVAVKTNPLNINARVSVDGEEVGSTKGGVLTINRLEAGTRVFKITNGKKHKEMSVNVLPEETVDLNVDFKK